ncbi:recombinase RecT [Streptomyces lydicus]|uniref:recombinase RecT n=1 Tax=Streptomyces lydicus TaxID=47763 RepID=UPI0037AE522B
MPNGPQAPVTAEGPTQHTQNQAPVPATRPAPVAQNGSQALSLTAMSVKDAWGFAQALAGSSILPRQYQGNAGSILWALEFGRGLGLDVITTIQSVHIIQGKATMSADLMASLCRRAGHRMRVSGDETNAKVVIFRADDPEFPFEVSWTMDRAKQAQLTSKDTWKQYPAAMLRARAISECVRMACPEVLHGAIYTPEERGAAIDEDGLPVDAPVQQRASQAQYTVTQERPAPAPGPAPAVEAPQEATPEQGPSQDEVLDKLYLQAIANRSNVDVLKQIIAGAKQERVIEREVDGPPPARERMTFGALLDLLLADAQAMSEERNAA